MKCRHCGSEKTRRNGKNRGIQRYICKDCGRTFSERDPAFSKDTKRQAIFMYLNNVGIRKTALFLGASPTAVVNWIKEKHKILESILREHEPDYSETADIIEMDEIYTFIEKNGNGYRFGLLTLGTKSVLLRLK